MKTTVFFDVETSGLNPTWKPNREELSSALHDVLLHTDADDFYLVAERCLERLKGNQIIQIAAVAVGEDWKELETFERKLEFHINRADKDALAMNCYVPLTWDDEAVEPELAMADFRGFLARHKTLRLISKRGRPYYVAQLAGHNITRFDQSFVEALNAETSWDSQRPPFIQGTFPGQGFDTLLFAAFLRAFVWTHPPENLRLETLCGYYGFEHPDAHDALGDVRANIKVARAMLVELNI